MKRNLVSSVGRAVKHDPKRIRQILFEVCQQAENAIFGEDELDYEAFFTNEDDGEGSQSDEFVKHEEENETPDVSENFHSCIQKVAKTYNSKTQGLSSAFDPTDL